MANEAESDDEEGNGGAGAALGRRHGQTESSSDGKYVPPKLTAVHYDGDESRQERERKKQERAKKRALGLSIIHDLKEEFLDNPTEISGSSRAQQMLSSAQREKEEYEETYLTRLPVTKAEKIRERKLTTMGEWEDDLMGLFYISFLTVRLFSALNLIAGTLGDEMTRFGDAGKGSKKKRRAGGAAGDKKHKKRRFK